jgi:transposase-like protein
MYESMPITPSNPFKGRHFPGEVIVLCVRWYLRRVRWVARHDAIASADFIDELFGISA